MNPLYQNYKTGKGVEAMVDDITAVNQCEFFNPAYGDSKYNYLLSL